MVTSDSTANLVAAPPLSGCRVLVADDDPVCRELAATALETAGAAVVRVTDGREAVLRVVSGVPDLLVTDLDMPELDGLATAGILRWDFGLVGLPIIALSSQSPPAANLLACGVNAFLTKPVTAEQLIDAVIACLAGVAPSASDEPDAVGPLLAFDADGALTRMGHRSRLLERMVTLFLANHRDTGHRLATALASGDLYGAHRLCHALSGTGATVGAVRLYTIARHLTRQLNEDKRPDAGTVTELESALAATETAMLAWLDSPR